MKRISQVVMFLNIVSELKIIVITRYFYKLSKPAGLLLFTTGLSV